MSPVKKAFFLTGNYSFCWFKNGWIILDAELVGSPAQEFVNIDFVTVDIDEAEAALGYKTESVQGVAVKVLVEAHKK